MPRKIVVLARVALMALSALLVTCTSGNRSLPSPGRLGESSMSRVLSPLSLAAGQTPGILFWGNSYVMKIRLEDDHDFKKRSYGDQGLIDLTTDRHHNVHEVAFEYDNSVVSEFGTNLKARRSFQVPNTTPEALAIGKDGEQYLGLYDVKSNRNSIEVFDANASGSPPPLRTIAGSKTSLSCIAAEAPGSKYLLYVANWGAPCGGGPNNVLVFAPHAHGNAEPLRTISGDQTGITGPVNLALGADGNIYVANEVSGGTSPTFNILVFPTSANGNVAPIRILQTGSYGGTIALGSSGEMYVGQGPTFGDAKRNFSENGGIAVYAPGASGNDSPIGYVGKNMESQAYRIALQYPWYVP